MDPVVRHTWVNAEMGHAVIVPGTRHVYLVQQPDGSSSKATYVARYRHGGTHYRTEECATAAEAEARAKELKGYAAATGSPAARWQGYRQLQGSTGYAAHSSLPEAKRPRTSPWPVAPTPSAPTGARFGQENPSVQIWGSQHFDSRSSGYQQPGTMPVAGYSGVVGYGAAHHSPREPDNPSQQQPMGHQARVSSWPGSLHSASSFGNTSTTAGASTVGPCPGRTSAPVSSLGPGQEMPGTNSMAPRLLCHPAGPVPPFRQQIQPAGHVAPAALPVYAARSFVQQTAGLVQLGQGKVTALHSKSSLSPEPPRHFLVTRQLGTGTFAEVWEAKMLVALPRVAAAAAVPAAAGSSHFGVATASCALKVIKGDDSNQRLGNPGWKAVFGRQCDETESEFIQYDLIQDHSSFPQYVVRAYEWGEIQYSDGHKTTYILQEYANGGSLQQHLQQTAALSKAGCMAVMKQLGPGLLGCHQSGVIHRDLKPSNLLQFVAADGTVTYKISDLGESRFIADMIDTTRSVHGTTPYMAPEMDGLRAISEKVDIWSAGLVYLAARTGDTPFHYLWRNRTANQTALNIRHSYYGELSKPDCPYRVHGGVQLCTGQVFGPLDEDEVAFLLDCLELDPSKRLSMRRLLEKYRIWLGLPRDNILG